jgi:phosphate transport system substrate-binding protein
VTTKYQRTMTLKIAAPAFALLLAACGGSQSTSSSSSAGTPGSVSISGSTALLPLVKQAAVDYQGAHENVKISVAGGGSRVGITQVAQRAVDIGDSDIPAQNEPSLVDHKVAIVIFGIIVNPQTGVKNLTTAQLRGIFGGAITNWSQAGGRSGPITVINRPRSSGTRAVLVSKILGGHEPSESGLTQDSSGTVSAMVAQTPGAISYLGLAYVQPGAQTVVSIDGIEPAQAGLKNYPYWSYEHMYTNGQPSAQVAGFINFVIQDRPLLRRLKFAPMGSGKD